MLKQLLKLLIVVKMIKDMYTRYNVWDDLTSNFRHLLKNESNNWANALACNANTDKNTADFTLDPILLPTKYKIRWEKEEEFKTTFCRWIKEYVKYKHNEICTIQYSLK